MAFIEGSIVVSFKPGNRYRHASCLEIDFDVRMVLGQTDTEISLIVTYWNRHMKIHQGRHQTVKVPKSQLSEWQDLGSVDPFTESHPGALAESGD